MEEEVKLYRMTPEAREYHRNRRAAQKAGTWVGRKKPEVDTQPCDVPQTPVVEPPEAA